MPRPNLQRPVFPVSLLLEDRSCLVVGAGRIALRKVRKLLAAQARVTVVAPAAVSELADLAAAGSLTWNRREFRPADVVDCAVVYAAATRPVNLAVLSACRQHRVLCAAVDKSWPDGDFVTPATLHHGGLTVAVSTGGRDCRQARLVKDSLARHLTAAARLDLLVIGTSFEQLPLARREKLAMDPATVTVAGRMLRQLHGLQEFMLLSTCNRVELLAVAAADADLESAIRHLLGFGGLGPYDYYVLRGTAAFEHAAALCAGLLSQARGETRIVAQVKAALATAIEAGTAGGVLQDWVAAALFVAKAVRADSQAHGCAPELEASAVDQFCALMPLQDTARVLVLGSGIIGRAVVGRVLDNLPRAAVAWCFHEHRPTVPAAWHGRVQVRAMAELVSLLPVADAVIAASACQEPLLRADHAPLLQREQPVPVLDLGVPRNVAPALAAVPGLHLYNLDTVAPAPVTPVRDHGQTRLGELLVQHRDLYESIRTSLGTGGTGHPSGSG